MTYSVDYTDFDNCILYTMEGRKFHINVTDISVLVSWNPTMPVQEIKIDGIKYIESLSNGMRARLS